MKNSQRLPQHSQELTKRQEFQLRNMASILAERKRLRETAARVIADCLKCGITTNQQLRRKLSDAGIGRVPGCTLKSLRSLARWMIDRESEQASESQD